MNQQAELGAQARTIIEANFYLTLGTADETGHPWVSPVYYATADYRSFYWVSSPDVRHSRNIAVRPQVSMVIFDSHAAINTGQGVYMSAVANELAGSDLERELVVFSSRLLAHGAQGWSLDNSLAPAPYRLYQATVSEYSVLAPGGGPDHRIAIGI